MTRLIVKNLPDSASRDKLFQTFSEKGLVTDLQLKFTKEGKFRHFAFLGYKTDEEAETALKYFHNTYVGSCKISVERCVRLGENISVKAAKKKNALPAETKTKKPGSEEVQDSKLTEFLEVHGQKKTGNLWSNDTLAPPQATAGKSTEKSKKTGSSHEEDDEEESEVNPDAPANAAISDMEYLKKKVVESNAKAAAAPKAKKVFQTVRISGLPNKARKKEVKQLLHPLKAKSIRVPQRVPGIAYVGFATLKERNIALNKDRTFFEGKRISVRPYEKKVKETVGEGEELPTSWRQQAEKSKNLEAIPETGRIFVRNLPYDVSEDELQKNFEQFGPVTEVIVPVDKFTRKGKGFALVTFMLPEHAAAAYAALDGSVFQGRMLHLLPAKEKPEPKEETEEGSSFKKKKAQDQKAAAGVTLSWNTLFLGANAVADVVAETYGTTKAAVLTEGQSQTSLAVRMALGETQVVGQTRSFLEDNGVDLKAFTNPDMNKIERSKTVLLVKNLPASTSPTELRTLFEEHGVLGRVLLPPSGITAIIEFLEPAEARMAFRSLAYTKFRNVPLYLEWAPVNALIGPAKANRAVGNRNQPSNAKPEEVKEVNDEELLSEENATLFVKNLNWSTTDEDLRKLFAKCGPLVQATVSRKLKDKELLSLGYGFVQYQRKKDALEALKTFQLVDLDGHKLELKASNRQRKENETVRKPSANAPISSKLCVRNVPFQASHKEVLDLFKTFGELKSVRLPKKVGGTGSHRGFAFVEFVTKEDAKRAFDALSASTHLYGRRLVLEWAAAEESVEDIRKRTAMNFFEGSSAKKKKTDILGEGNEDES